MKMDLQTNGEPSLPDSFIEVYLRLSETVLRHIVTLFGDSLQFSLEVTNADSSISHTFTQTWILATRLSGRICKTTEFNGLFRFPDSWRCIWTLPQQFGLVGCSYSAEISVVIIQGSPILNTSFSPSVFRVERCRDPGSKKMLDEEIGTDTTIFTAEGSAVKCHKVFITAHSSVLHSMFENDFKEAQCMEIQMIDMTEAGVRALLAYLYYWDLAKPKDDYEIALELLQCSHKYEIEPLEKAIKGILMSKPNESFDMSMTLHLFFFVSKVESMKDLKAKCLEILKRNRKSFVKSPEYDQLFDEDPQAAKQLFTAIMELL